MIEYFDFEPDNCYYAELTLPRINGHRYDAGTIKINDNYEVQVFGNDSIIGSIKQDNYGRDFLHLEYKNDPSKQLNFFYIFSFDESYAKFEARSENNRTCTMTVREGKCKFRSNGMKYLFQHLFPG